MWKALAILPLASAHSASSRENLVWPLAQLNDEQWPLLKVTYGYEISGTLSGTMVEEDSQYSYTKEGGMKEPKQIIRPFQYYIEAKIDSRGNRAIQSLYKDQAKTELLKTVVTDFHNARTSTTDYYNCQVTQYNRSLLTIGQLLRVFWTPGKVVYSGPQCVNQTNMSDTLAFKGIDAEGVPWWTFFDSSSRKLIHGQSGSAQHGSTEVEINVLSWRPRWTFEESEFQMCTGDVEILDQSIIPLGDFGFFMM